MSNHDWLTDPRRIYDCLNEWRAIHGWPWAETAERIGQKLATVKQWGKAGREPANTMPTRIIMMMIDEQIK